MKKLILFFGVFTTVGVHAQKEKAAAYIHSFKEIAIAEMIRTGVPASITLAQGILESQYGESDLVKNSNNHFGIKCKTEWTGARTYHDDDARGECFRVYPTAAESYTDHSDFLKTRAHYAFLFKLDPTDFEGWAKGLKKAGYATLPTYPQKLMKIINEYNLQQYSLLALARIQEGSPSTDPAVPVNTTAPLPYTATETPTAAAAKAEMPAIQTSTTAMEVIPAAARKNNVYPQGVFEINHTKVIYGTEGTSLLSIAGQYEIPLSKLLEFNDLPEMDVLDMDRLIFVQKKQKKGSNEFHTVAGGETLHAISQLEGVRLDSILEYNNFKKALVPPTGTRIYLRTVVSAAATKPSRVKTSK